MQGKLSIGSLRESKIWLLEKKYTSPTGNQYFPSVVDIATFALAWATIQKSHLHFGVKLFKFTFL